MKVLHVNYFCYKLIDQWKYFCRLHVRVHVQIKSFVIAELFQGEETLRYWWSTIRVSLFVLDSICK